MRVQRVTKTFLVITVAAQRFHRQRNASLMILDEEVGVGDYVVVHAGFAISKLDEAEALETLQLMREAFPVENYA